MIKQLAYAVLTFGCMVLCVTPIRAQHPQTGFYKDYHTWRARFKTYACAMQVESVVDIKAKPTKFRDQWVICAKSEKLGVTRLDTKTVADFSPANANRFAGAATTTLRTSKRVLQFLDPRQTVIDLEKELTEIDFQKLSPQPRVDPFSLPLIGWGAFASDPILPERQDSLDRLVAKAVPIGEPIQVGSVTKLKFQLAETYELFDHLQLDERVGEGQLQFCVVTEKASSALRKSILVAVVQK